MINFHVKKIFNVNSSYTVLRSLTLMSIFMCSSLKDAQTIDVLEVRDLEGP